MRVHGRSAQRGCLFAASLALVGCSMMPVYERPGLPVPSRFPESATVAAAASELPDWRDYFQDVQLRRLIETALAHNRDLRVAAAQIERAQALYRVQRAQIWPRVDGQARAELQSGTSDLYTLGVGVTAFELDLFGRVASLREAALAQYLATESAHRAVQLSLVSNVASAYLQLLADEALLQVTTDTLAAREESLRLIRVRVEGGLSSELDLRQAEGLVAGARANVAQLQRQRARDRQALALLTGQELPPMEQPAAADAWVRLPASLAPVPAGLPSDLLVRRPDILAAEQRLRAANANIGAARAAFFPRISLTAAIGLVSRDLQSLLDGGTGWTFAPQATLPLFDRGSNQANLAVAQADRDIAVAQYEGAIQGAFREVADALAGVATLGEELAATRMQEQSAQAALTLAQARYQGGVSSFLDVLDAQRNLLATRQAAIQVGLAELQNRIKLYEALGGGWSPTP